jgi:hypothetical protein
MNCSARPETSIGRRSRAPCHPPGDVVQRQVGPADAAWPVGGGLATHLVLEPLPQAALREPLPLRELVLPPGPVLWRLHRGPALLRGRGAGRRLDRRSRGRRGGLRLPLAAVVAAHCARSRAQRIPGGLSRGAKRLRDTQRSTGSGRRGAGSEGCRSGSAAMGECVCRERAGRCAGRWRRQVVICGAARRPRACRDRMGACLPPGQGAGDLHHTSALHSRPPPAKQPAGQVWGASRGRRARRGLRGGWLQTEAGVQQVGQTLGRLASECAHRGRGSSPPSAAAAGLEGWRNGRPACRLASTHRKQAAQAWGSAAGRPAPPAALAARWPGAQGWFKDRRRTRARRASWRAS